MAPKKRKDHCWITSPDLQHRVLSTRLTAQTGRFAFGIDVVSIACFDAQSRKQKLNGRLIGDCEDCKLIDRVLVQGRLNAVISLFADDSLGSIAFVTDDKGISSAGGTKGQVGSLIDSALQQSDQGFVGYLLRRGSMTQAT